MFAWMKIPMVWRKDPPRRKRRKRRKEEKEEKERGERRMRVSSSGLRHPLDEGVGFSAKNTAQLNLGWGFQ